MPFTEMQHIYRDCLINPSRVVMYTGRCEKHREGLRQPHGKWVGELTGNLLGGVWVQLMVGTMNGSLRGCMIPPAPKACGRGRCWLLPGPGQMSLRPERGAHRCRSVPSNNSQKMEVTQLSITRWMDKQKATCHGLLFSLIKEGHPVTCYSVDEPWGHHTKWNKSDTER